MDIIQYSGRAHGGLDSTQSANQIPICIRVPLLQGLKKAKHGYEYIHMSIWYTLVPLVSQQYVRCADVVYVYNLGMGLNVIQIMVNKRAAVFVRY